MTANPILLQKKYARIIKLFSTKENLSFDDSLNFFYRSTIYRLISEGVSDLHCMSDEYLAEELISEYQVERIVLGYPKNMNNTVGERAVKSLEFKEKLEKRTGLPVVMWDERLTTAEAERTLMETGVRRENRKQFLDQMAAVLILQGYLDRMNMNKDENNGEN